MSRYRIKLPGGAVAITSMDARHNEVCRVFIPLLRDDRTKAAAAQTAARGMTVALHKLDE